MAAIELRGVTKRYERGGFRRSGTVTALRNLDLTVEDGEIFGFLGPSGAGKSTTIDVLLDYVEPTEGAITVLGPDVATDSVGVRERTGVLPDGYGPIGGRTGREHVEFAIGQRGWTTTRTNCRIASVCSGRASIPSRGTRKGWPSGSCSRWRSAASRIC